MLWEASQSVTNPAKYFRSPIIHFEAHSTVVRDGKVQQTIYHLNNLKLSIFVIDRT